MTMRLLLGAYSCYPGLTSEPGNAWRLIHELLPDHEIWAVIEGGHRHEEGIMGYIRDHPMPGFHPLFIRYAKPMGPLLKGRGMLESVYYHLWQERLLPGFVRELQQRIGFDVAHHITYGRYWSPSGLRGLDLPFIWGPIGAAETPPRPFVAELPFNIRVFEWIRDAWRSSANRSRSLRDTAKAASVAIGVTAETCKTLKGLGARRVELLPQMALLDDEVAKFDSFPPPAPGPFRALCMGRLLHWKGFHLAIRAFARFAKSKPQAELWLINDGPFRKELEKEAAQSGVGSQITFFGRMESYAAVMQKLAEAHVLLHPALHEGFGNVCLEALAAGRPVLCLDIGGPASQISPDTGYAAPATTPAESVEALASFLTRLDSDRALLGRMSAAARVRARERFTMRRYGAELRRFYSEAIEEHKHEPVAGRR